MYTFEQNAELTMPHDPLPLVAENVFLNMVAEDEPLPQFEKIRDMLPHPVWEGHDDHIGAYYKAWEIAFGNLRRPEPNTGFVSDFIDSAFNDHIFMWDSCFMLMFGKYADQIFHFQKTLDNFYSHQHRDGFICRTISEKYGTDRFTRYDPSSTGPEVLPWCEWEYYLHFGDRERLTRVFPPLMAYHRWMKEHFTWQDGSYFSTGWGCGMDNIPRQSGSVEPAFSHGHMVWIDTCIQALLSCKTLMKIAKEIDRTEFLDELANEAESLDRIINQKLWDEESGFYYDLWRNGKHNFVRHIGAFWALLAECAPKDRAQRLIAYLRDENEFKTPTRVPALSKSNNHYSPDGGYWCGGVWAPTNYMVLKGLDAYGEYQLAHEIGTEFLNSVVEVYQDHRTLFENYAPEKFNGRAAHGRAKPDFVGWTGLAPITVLFEYVFGMKPNAKNHKLVWHVELLERHGVEKYPLGENGEVTLLCEARKCSAEAPQITLRANVPVEVEIIWGKDGEKESMILRT